MAGKVDFNTGLKESDNPVYSAIQSELVRQREGLEMIPSENYVSRAVLDAMGSILTNKYSEGYPGKRYYGGNEFIDVVENLARDRAKALFGVSHVNVQPYSGSPANQAITFALLDPGEKLMGLHLLYGGHLTHGWNVNFSGRYYTAIQYTTREDGWLDYDAIAEQASREKPKMIWIGTTAYPRELDFKRMQKIALENDAYLVADVSHITGLIIAGVHQSPFGIADVVMTTTHKTLRGPRGAIIACNGEASEPLKAPPEKSRKYLPTMIDRAVFPGLQGGPHNHQTAGIAVALGEASKPEFKEYGKQVAKNASVLAKALMDQGFKLVTDGTDNHLLLIDLTTKGLGGKEGEALLESVGITCNKNTVPFDKRKPYDPSGVRMGTPALTSRGMKEAEMTLIAQFIQRTIDRRADAAELSKVKAEIKHLCKDFPIY